MPSFERGRGRRRHLWEITIEGNALVIRHGNPGKEPETYRREYHHASDAEAEIERIIASRIADGYTPVRDEPAPSPPAPRSEIERQLRANPDDSELALVVADWLQQQGDPRGRLIVMQHDARHGSPELEAEEHDLLTTHAAALLGGLARYDRTIVECRWKRGWIAEVRLAHDDAFPEDTVAEMVRAVCRLPDAPFIEAIALGMPDGDPDHNFDYVIEELVAHAAQLPRLSRLFVGDFIIGDEAELSWTHLGNLAPVFHAWPRLATLTIQGGTFELGTTIEAPSLRDLEIRTGGLAASDISALVAATLPNLERLVVWFGSTRYGGGGASSDVVALAQAHERVRHLGICNAEFTDEACRLLAELPIAPRLVSLDLSNGTLTDDGATALAGGAFRQLAHLDVRGNYLSERGIATLQAMGVELRGGSQRVAIDDERYPAVGE